MPAPAKPFTIIADSRIDADSPVTEELMTFIRDNIEHLEEWLGKNYVAAVDHDHDGVNSKLTSVASSIFWLNVPVTKFSGNPSTTYTTISVAADTGANTAKTAIIGISLSGTGVAANPAALNLRQTGTTGPQAVVEIPNAAIGTMKTTVLCPLDASETFQYAKVSNGLAAATIVIVGYII